MKKEEVIERIIKNESSHRFKELLSWIQESEKNRNEFIQYKNVWALLQRGKEMDKKYVEEDYKHVKARINKDKNKFVINKFIKYAAIIVVALISGYLLNTKTLPHNIAVNEISVPNGNRSLIVLPDGSKVWLTNGSKIIYPDHFTGKSRNVELQGEAFFTVSHDENKPFFVHLGKHRVKVLGTEFSVLAYPEDNIIQVDLVSGKVELDVKETNRAGNYKSYSLNPLHSLVLDKTSGNLEHSEIPDSFYKYWQEGVFEFKNEPFENLAKKMERIYSVKIILEDSILNHSTFTGAFHIESNVYTIMETFKRASSTPFEYNIDNDHIYVKRIK